MKLRGSPPPRRNQCLKSSFRTLETLGGTPAIFCWKELNLELQAPYLHVLGAHFGGLEAPRTSFFCQRALPVPQMEHTWKNRSFVPPPLGALGSPQRPQGL